MFCTNDEKETFKMNLTGLLNIEKNKGVTAKRIAEQIQTTPKKLSSWKNGDYLPSDTELKYLCQYFKCEAHELFYNKVLAIDRGWDPCFNNVEPVKVAVQTLSDEAQELVRLFNTLPVKKRVQLLSYAYELNDEGIDVKSDVKRLQDDITVTDPKTGEKVVL